jgi:hypothetical protein
MRETLSPVGVVKRHARLAWNSLGRERQRCLFDPHQSVRL